jgi:hypothetical protein
MKKSIALFAFGMLFLLNGCSYSTANISDVKMCAQIQEEGLFCESDTAVFASTTPAIYVSATLNNAPADTKVKFTWKYLPDNFDISSIDLVGGEENSALYSYLEAPDNGWPLGEYEIVIKVDSDNSDPISKKFEVK